MTFRNDFIFLIEFIYSHTRTWSKISFWSLFQNFHTSSQNSNLFINETKTFLGQINSLNLFSLKFTSSRFHFPVSWPTFCFLILSFFLRPLPYFPIFLLLHVFKIFEEIMSFISHLFIPKKLVIILRGAEIIKVGLPRPPSRFLNIKQCVLSSFSNNKTDYKKPRFLN